MIDEMRQQID